MGTSPPLRGKFHIVNNFSLQMNVFFSQVSLHFPSSTRNMIQTVLDKYKGSLYCRVNIRVPSHLHLQFQYEIISNLKSLLRRLQECINIELKI